MTKIYSALALLLATTSPSFADEPVTKWQWGCEWQQADNGNYWFKTDGGCKHYIALGYSTMADYNKDVKPEAVDEDEDDGEEPTDPGDDEGPGDDGDNGTDPGDNGGGDEGPCDEGPSKPGKPGKPGKGKGRA